ncbi:MAG TPA: UDP-N-acetylglucosamine 2-epimerase (hydrolyzing) [Nitrospirae bacterium]|nr:GDP/UDP-N,N'-diacetylbacillosamine 2-epimerase [bacterium BMS3Abin06]HDH11412.1 UDP-N-acetylglucosamine 2-epimerase (hydrolyzing) [Nitrospirota bacterium]HDZ01434.1 UDP-N-acetylglucosamine 2-epimerase (hydrolyzing) [Nitrospirota bacterium]
MLHISKKKICIVTGTRAEYGLFYPLLKRLENNATFDLQIVATGMHLSPEFGMTYQEIEEDGFDIKEKVEMLLSSDTGVGISKSIGIGMLSFADVFERLKPDLLIVLGDRFEIFAAVLSAFIAKIPIAHLHGGELTEGVIDDALRHSITKMSCFHFTSTEKYRKRVIQLGESPDRVFNVGAIGLDNINETELLQKEELENRIYFKFNGKTALVTFHPVTLENNSSEKQFKELLYALEEIKELKIIFTKPNADTDGRVIIELINEYGKSNPGKAISFSSMGRLNYLSAMKYVELVIGNSSSGIIEFPSFGKPTVNIGERQRGRIKAESVIDCGPVKDDIKAAIKKALSDDFRGSCEEMKNPYGNGGASEKIVNILKDKLSGPINLKKAFFDIKKFSLDEMKADKIENRGDVNAAERYIHC